MYEYIHWVHLSHMCTRVRTQASTNPVQLYLIGDSAIRRVSGFIQLMWHFASYALPSLIVERPLLFDRKKDIDMIKTGNMFV